MGKKKSEKEDDDAKIFRSSRSSERLAAANAAAAAATVAAANVAAAASAAAPPTATATNALPDIVPKGPFKGYMSPDHWELCLWACKEQLREILQEEREESEIWQKEIVQELTRHRRATGAIQASAQDAERDLFNAHRRPK